MTDEVRIRYALLLVETLMENEYQRAPLLAYLERSFTDNRIEELRMLAVDLVRVRDAIRQRMNLYREQQASHPDASPKL